jgi:hypothetical protein
LDLLLLSAGAIVLIGITLWIVWPARSADRVGVSVQAEEVLERPMTEAMRAGLAPQGDRFEDQYTSATADLSPGGVAAAVEAMQADAQAAPPTPRESYGTPVRPTVAAAPFAEPEPTRSLAPRRSMGLGAGALLALGGGVGGAWLYARWQRERDKPINRLRRGAREMAGRLGERIPDVDELPHGAAPMSGAATALLLAALLATRSLHRDADDDNDRTQAVRDRAAEILRDSAQDAMERGRDAVKRGGKQSRQLQADAIERGRDAVKRGRKQSRQLQARIPTDSLPSADAVRKPKIMGIGLGGIALVAGGAFAIWRLLHRGQPDRSTWYAGE